MKKNLVIGCGEIGSAIRSVLNCDGHDPEQGLIVDGEYDTLHICIPYSDMFCKIVNRYRNTFGARALVIHSTVKLGTSNKLQAVYSPVRGVHPHMVQGLRTFVKYFGGPGAAEAAEIFKEKGIKVQVIADARSVEALKLWDTTQYGAMILLNREIYTWCQEHGVDFNTVYTEANRTYNEGYAALGRAEVVRPYLRHTTGEIGGHCVRQNAALFENKYVKELNESR